MKPHHLALLVTTLFLVSVSGVYAVGNMGLIPCEGVGCKACDFVSLGNNILKWFVAIMAGIISLMFALGGFTLLMSGGNSGKVSEGKEMMTNAIIGLLIVLSAWLIVNTIFKTVVGGSISGNWYEIKCVPNPSLTADPAKSNVVASGGAGGGAGASGSVSGAGSNSAITGAINSLGNFSSASAAGTNGGRSACAWAVNQVLSEAGIAPLDGNSVKQMEDALTGGRGTLVDQSSAQSGDIVILTSSSGNHTGICLNNGCTEVVSNKSSDSTFSWKSGPTFCPSYCVDGKPIATPRIYSVNQ